MRRSAMARSAAVRQTRWVAVLGLTLALTALEPAAAPAGGVARADSTENAVVQQRLEATEKKLDVALERIDDLTRLVGQQPAQQAMSQDQIVQIVKDQMAKNTQPNDLRVYWDRGVNFATADKAFTLKIGGRIETDYDQMGMDSAVMKAVGPFMDGFETRRLYLSFNGTIYTNTAYKVDLDFGGATVHINNAYMQMNNLLPFAQVRVGQFKEPINLDNLTDDTNIMFMERALPTALVPTYQKGAQIMNNWNGKRGTWAAGVFWDTSSTTAKAFEDPQPGSVGTGEAFTARVTYLPWYEDNGAKLVHVGAAVSYRNESAIEYKSTPEDHLAPTFIDAKMTNTSSATLGGLETALVYGPASVQAEYIQSDVRRTSGSDLGFSGYYVQASYFLTGEHRAYNTGSGAFDTVSPKNNFDGKGGLGAWELAARYSHLDLDDKDVHGGQLSDITAGLNWYLNPNMKIMLNYVSTQLSADTKIGDAHSLMARFQVVF